MSAPSLKGRYTKVEPIGDMMLMQTVSFVKFKLRKCGQTDQIP
jgi:hypothetical protein